mmetsp:Transcript_22607/g.89751  ORF Transcript_22607/g.89751 Transcript_22607/m.89751 type:complete len:101 (-) Transcript_22607:1329-1631(-)
MVCAAAPARCSPRGGNANSAVITGGSVAQIIETEEEADANRILQPGVGRSAYKSTAQPRCTCRYRHVWGASTAARHFTIVDVHSDVWERTAVDKVQGEVN